MKALKITSVVLVAVMLCACLAGCGYTLNGTYETLGGTVSFIFKGNKVTFKAVSLIGTVTTFDGTYKIDEEAGTITFTWDTETEDDTEAVEDYNGTLEFSENKEEGTIKIGIFTFTKKQNNAK